MTGSEGKHAAADDEPESIWISPEDLPWDCISPDQVRELADEIEEKLGDWDPGPIYDDPQEIAEKLRAAADEKDAGLQTDKGGAVEKERYMSVLDTITGLFQYATRGRSVKFAYLWLIGWVVFGAWSNNIYMASLNLGVALGAFFGRISAIGDDIDD